MDTKEALKNTFILAITEVMPLFQMCPVFHHEEERNFLDSADDVNVLISFSHTLEGNIVFGFQRESAIKVASLIRGITFTVLDMEAKNALGEVAALVSNIAISKYQIVNSINITPPILATGDNLFLMISRVKTTKLIFQNHSDQFSVSYCIEQSSQRH